ncbi:hypothetical protein PN466_23635 [Roseofilum reptotaenium CS-1145]|nr:MULTISPECIES: hypothetical protein [Roseofilum]MDB9519941.1 hypothetical protein [Roseofilum reptotaenium CS-1145]
MNILFLGAGVILALMTISIILDLVTARRYESSASVANTYDQ